MSKLRVRFFFVTLPLFLLIHFKSFAQQSLELDNQLIFKTSPLSLFEPETIVIQGGIEYFFNPKFSIQSEFGFNGGLVGIPSGRGKNENFKLWRSKNELKFHTKNHYWALELFYVNKDLNRTDDFYTPYKTVIWYEKAHIDIEVFGTGIKFGKQKFVSKNILVDGFFGLGIRSRFRKIQVIEPSPNQNQEDFTEVFFSPEKYRFNGWDYIPHMSMGFKVGILSKK